MTQFVRPPEEWSLHDLKALGVRTGVTYGKAVPVLILEEWERKGGKEGEPFYVSNQKLAERLESSGLHPPFEGKDKSNIVAPMTTIQKSRNLKPFLIEKAGKGFSQVNLPHYEPLLRKYLQYYRENYSNDYRKLYPEVNSEGLLNGNSTLVTDNKVTHNNPEVVKVGEVRSKQLMIIQMLEEYEKAWQEKVDEAEKRANAAEQEVIELREKLSHYLTPEIPVNPRERIPEDIRRKVWQRDGGKCARCGTREKLEYDHIVPISRGGSNTIRNIELLCEQCNRSKGRNIE